MIRRNTSWSVLAGALGSIIAVQAANASRVEAHAAADFVPGASSGELGTCPDSSGDGTWTFGKSPSSNPAGDSVPVTPLTWDPGCDTSGAFDNGSADSFCAYPLIARMLGQPAVRLSPGFSEYAVLRWVAGADQAGRVSITGNIRKADIESFGDGVEVFIYVDGTQRLYRQLSNVDDVGVDFLIQAVVTEGSTVDFVVGSDGPDPNGAPPIDGDTTFVSATIISSPANIVGALDGEDDREVDADDLLEFINNWGPSD